MLEIYKLFVFMNVLRLSFITQKTLQTFQLLTEIFDSGLSKL